MALFYLSSFFSSSNSTPFSFNESSYHPYKHNIDVFNNDFSHIKYYVSPSYEKIISRDKYAKLKFEFDVINEYQNLLNIKCQEHKRRIFFSQNTKSEVCDELERLFGSRR